MFRQFKIGVRIAAAFAIIFSLGIISNYFVTMSDVADVVNSAEQRELATHYKAFIGLVEADDRHLGGVEFRASIDAERLQAFKQYSGIDTTLYVPDGGSFRKQASSWEAGIVEDGAVLKRAFEGQPTTREINYRGQPYKLYLAPVSDSSGKPVAVVELAMDRGDYLAQLAHGRNKLIAGGVTALVVGLLVFAWLGRGIVGPLQRAADSMHDIASGEGDLTQRLAARGNDEVTVMAKGFNQFASRIQAMIKQVGGSTNALAEAADDLKQITESTRGGVQRQRNEIDQVATAMTEMAATVQEVARNAATAAEAARDANDEAGSGKRVVEETIRAINALAGEVQGASDVINQLAADSEAIGGVLDVIRGIAEQTNLLALNAAIEAARAGEQGRGFAVVADEVRTLAQRTQTSTQEIQGMIEKVQGGARNAVAVMESGRDKAADSVSKASEAGASLGTINYAVSAINDMNMQIASAAEEQSAVAEEINRNIVNIGTVADETAEGSNRIAAANEHLVRLGSELQEIVNQFKV